MNQKLLQLQLIIMKKNIQLHLMSDMKMITITKDYYSIPDLSFTFECVVIAMGNS